MASGSSGRPNSGSKGYDFGTDDILCSYDDFANQDSSNGNHSDSVVNSSSGKDFQKNRMARSSVFPAPVYGQQEDSVNQEVIATVEKSMKKHTDNLLRFLEGISARLSQLELYCYNLDKSIGEMRSDLVRDHEEADVKLKFLEKHLQEVHRSVQILRDKQELSDTQKELAKLQLAQKESSSNHSQSHEERPSPPASDPKKTDNMSDTHGQQLALVLPHQVAPPQQSMAPHSQAPPQNVSQQQSYYLPPSQLLTPPVHIQHPQNMYLPSDPHYGTSQLQDISRVARQPTQAQVNVTPTIQTVPQYQQQWTQQLPQQVFTGQQPSIQSQMRPPSTSIYHTYPQSQPTNAPPPDTLPNSMPMHVPFSGIPQSGSRSDSMPYGYAGSGRTVQQQQQQPPTQQHKGSFGPQPGDGYGVPGSHPALPGNAYMMYDSEVGRSHHQPHQPHFPQGGYPPSRIPFQSQQPTTGANIMVRNPSNSQFIRNHPYNELIEKLMNMGFRCDHAASVIQRMEENGQTVDYNSVLDRLNVQSSGSSQRGWSG